MSREVLDKTYAPNDQLTPKERKGFLFRTEFRAFSFFYYGLLARPGTKRWEASKYFLGELTRDLAEGRTRSVGEDGEVILSPFDKNISGEANIPRNGPIIVHANHWSGGPYGGNWIHYAVPMVFRRNRDEMRDLRIIMQDGLLMKFLGIETAWRIPQTQKLASAIAKMYGLFLVTPTKRIEQGKEMSSLSQVKGILAAFKQGEPIGLYPEVTESREFKPGHFLAGNIAYALARTRPDALALPVGLHANTRDVISIKFGEPYSVRELLEYGPIAKDPDLARSAQQKIAQHMMDKTKPLVPSWAFV